MTDRSKPRREWTTKERAERFHERYGDDIDAGTTLVDLVKAGGLYLAKIVGEKAVAAAMVPIVETLDHPPFEPRDWAEALDESASDAFSSWLIGEQLHELAAYAEYGIVLGNRDAGQREEHLKTLIASAEAFLAESPLRHWNVGPEGETELEKLVRQATNRWALDHKEPIEPKALATFGGLAERSIRNMMAGAGRVFSQKYGRIPAHEALAWLDTRESFWNSIWREQPEQDHLRDSESPIASPVFVPVARDGSVFHPGIHRNDRFTVGPKGDERQFTDFYQALEELQKMPVPYWRRPNEKNAYGIVRGVRWMRLDRGCLASLADDRTFRLAAND